MRAMISLFLVLHPITTTNARTETEFLYLLHNYSVL
jgi:hypothetical protein